MTITALQLAEAEAACEAAHKEKLAILRESLDPGGGWSDRQWAEFNARLRAAEQAEEAASQRLKDLLERSDELFF